MNKYEAMVIFPDVMKDEAVEGALERIEGEIEKAGGKVDSKTRMGRRSFARPMQKQNAGQYLVVGFRIDGASLMALQGRLKLNEDIFRVQIVKAPAVVTPAKPVAEA